MAWFRLTSVTAATAALLATAPSAVLALSMGAGPSTIDGRFFTNDPSIRVQNIGVGSSDELFRGFTVTMPELPPGLYASFSKTEQVLSLDYDVPGPGNWSFPLVLGPTTSEFVGPASLSEKIYIRGKFDTGGGGVSITPGVALIIDFGNPTPQIPKTRWSFTNTTEYDIRDGYLMYAPRTHYIGGINVPAGATVTVEAQLDPTWRYTFGGILENGTDQVVIGIDDIAGPLPNAWLMGDLFGPLDPPRNGFSAAEEAWTPEAPMAWKPSDPNSVPCVTRLYAPVDSVGEFKLYAIPNGGVNAGVGSTDAMTVATVVGYVTATPIPEPTSLGLLLTLAPLWLYRRWLRKASERGRVE